MNVRLATEPEEAVPEFGDGDLVAALRQQSKPVVIEFWSEWCAPCRSFGAVIEQLMVELGDQVIIGRINLSEHPRTAERYAIASVPSTVVFVGAQVVRRISGPRPLAHLVREVSSFALSTPT